MHYLSQEANDGDLVVRGGCGRRLQIVIFKPISIIDTLSLSYKSALRWMTQDIADDKSTLVQVMAWRCPTTDITWANVDHI